MSRYTRTIVLISIAFVAVAGCRSGLPPTQFTNTAFDFSFVQRVAVLPFENLAGDREAGIRVTRVMTTELLASGTVEVVEPGEVQAALIKVAGTRPGRAPSLSTEQIVALGAELSAQAVIVGTVTQLEVLRVGSVSTPVVSIDAHMVEAETGESVWAATHTETGSSAAARLLGTGGRPLADTVRRCVRELLKTLIE